MTFFKKTVSAILSVSIILSFAACAAEKPQEEQNLPEEVNTKESILEELGLSGEAKGATEETIKVNSAFYSLLDFEDSSEYENATKGLIAAPEVLELKDFEGNVVWSQEAYSFIDDYEKAPDTVNPSLWENTKNNHVYGLFEVVDGIYQVRGYDMANLTVIEGKTGWILFDPLMTVECSTAAMQLISENLGERPVKAVIISHPHVDHYGGIEGVMSKEEAADASLSIEEQLASGKIPVIVPEGFAEHAVAENIYAGKAMSRRANYQYGVVLDQSETGKMALGIGMGQSVGTGSFVAPTYEIKETGEKIVIDGIEMEFQLTPGTEAPAEMNTWFPQFKALWVAENCTGTLHNLYTLRGAQIRDGAAWAKYIMEAKTRYGAEAEVVFQSHNWPHWGNETVNKYLVDSASIYQFINDQTLTYINKGYTADEISNMIKLPEELEKVWYTRQYYGTLKHNAQAVYQKYMGWYDANPVHLDPLEPTESAKKWVEYLGDTDEVLRLAKADFDKGEYRWVAEITNVLVFADPENEAARFLCADALEQLGYQSESGTWRSAYLSAAKELREGNLSGKVTQAKGGAMLREMTPEMIFGYMGIILDKYAVQDENIIVNLTVFDLGEQYILNFRNGVLLTEKGIHSEEADVSVTCPKLALLYLIQGNFEEFKKVAKIEGDIEKLSYIVENLNELSDSETGFFNIVEP
ncbi:MAG: MBL fold metallo-hydrolase [Oscillospiraceae bacterium]|nr:MBL fold metallo-hydrolase [Oscillospiraceae bacterium]